MSIDDALRETIREVVREEIVDGWRWRTAEQAAELLGITPDAVRRRVREGRMPGRSYGGRVYVDLVEFDRILRRRR